MVKANPNMGFKANCYAVVMVRFMTKGIAECKDDLFHLCKLKGNIHQQGKLVIFDPKGFHHVCLCKN